MKRILAILLSGICSFSSGQGAGSFNIDIKNGKVKGNEIEELNSTDFGFRCDLEIILGDTLYIEVIHGREGRARFQTTFAFTSQMKDYARLQIPEIKPGDIISFLNRNDTIQQKTYRVKSTVNSLTKPYFIDVYFIYNKDTISPDKFFIPTKLKYEKKKDYKRFFFDDPKEIPTRLIVNFKKRDLDFNFTAPIIATLFHGKVIIEYFDKKQFGKKYPFNKKINVTDLDSEIGLERVEWDLKSIK